ncbi:MAG: hypothetical protein AB1689_13740 [Thermodesulfobacteriota bacterium]
MLTAAAVVASLLLVASRRDAIAELQLFAAGGWCPYSSSLDVAGDARLEPGASGTWMVGAGWTFADHLAIVARWQELQADLATGAPRSFDGDLDVSSLNIGARYALLDSADVPRPWLELGGGWYHGSGELSRETGARDTSGDARERSFAASADAAGFTAAAGLELRLSPALAVVVELRYHWAADLEYLTPLAGVRMDLGAALVTRD